MTNRKMEMVALILTVVKGKSLLSLTVVGLKKVKPCATDRFRWMVGKNRIIKCNNKGSMPLW